SIVRTGVADRISSFLARPTQPERTGPCSKRRNPRPGKSRRHWLRNAEYPWLTKGSHFYAGPDRPSPGQRVAAISLLLTLCKTTQNRQRSRLARGASLNRTQHEHASFHLLRQIRRTPQGHGFFTVCRRGRS